MYSNLAERLPSVESVLNRKVEKENLVLFADVQFVVLQNLRTYL